MLALGRWLPHLRAPAVASLRGAYPYPAPPACSNVWLTSEQHLDINFNPASLLSMGDAMAFMRSAKGASSWQPPAAAAAPALDCSLQPLLPAWLASEICS